MNQRVLILSAIIAIGLIVGGIWYYSDAQHTGKDDASAPLVTRNDDSSQTVTSTPSDQGVAQTASSGGAPLGQASANQNATTNTNPPVAPAPVSEKTPINFMHTLTLHTNFGDIEFEAYDADAPKTVQNFLALSKKGFYDNLTFHRVIKGFMIQGGDPSGNGTGGPGYEFEDELNPTTQSYKNGYKKGVVAMANAGPNTNGSQFFIMLSDYPLPNSYTIFGKVIKGQDIVDTIGNVRTDGQDKPASPVIIKNVSITSK